MGHQLFDEIVRIGFERTQKIEQLNHIEPATTAFDLRDETLWAVKPACDVLRPVKNSQYCLHYHNSA
ncbi:hypothetical protein [Mycetohabitans sp. B46]|uniref:hypothetical protein n=1 Tax=Mycetohabitans sp. B46 TaxID=2772536 RepID=UPI00307DADE8